MLTGGITRSEKHSLVAATGAATVGISASVLVAPNLTGLLGAALSLLMVAIAAIDARHFIIPNELNGAALVLALVYAAAAHPQDAVTAVSLAMLRCAVLAGLFFTLRFVYEKFRRRKAIGLGDVKLAGVAGAWLGWEAMPIAVELAALVALIVYVSRQWALGRSLQSTACLPFGLFFAPAIWIAWLIEGLWLTR